MLQTQQRHKSNKIYGAKLICSSNSDKMEDKNSAGLSWSSEEYSRWK